MVGTPSLLARSGGGWDEAQRGSRGPAEQEDGRKRKMREMVESLEPGEKLEQGVEDVSALECKIEIGKQRLT